MKSKPVSAHCQIFKHDIYQIFTADLWYSIKSFDEQLYICETSYRYFYKNQRLYQAVCKIMTLQKMVIKGPSF